MKPLLILIAISFPLSFGLASIIMVPAQVSNINQGIEQSQPGDTILLEEGRYFEQIFFRGKGLTIASRYILDGDTSHISKTIIDGSYLSNPDSGSVVYFCQGTGINSILCGVTVTHGKGTLFNWHGTTQCTVGGIQMWGGGTLDHNIITNNTINRGPGINCQGGGIIVTNSDIGDTVIITNNKITCNTINGICGGGAGVMLCSIGYIRFQNNLVKKNIYNSINGYAVGGIAISGNDIWNGNIDLIGNLIQYNESNGTPEYKGMGGGIYIENSSPRIINNIILGNKSSGFGGGLSACWWNISTNKSKPLLINNTIVNNTSSFGGGISTIAVINNNVVLQIKNSILWGNAATYAQNQIYNENSILMVDFTDIQGGGFDGIENKRANPKFINVISATGDTLYCCMPGTSPCIDEGHLFSEYNDQEDPQNPGMALWPAQGTIRNDMGAFGGPTPLNLEIAELGDLLFVPHQISKIQDAIDLAQDGNTVLVDDGHYFENIDFRGKSIRVTSRFTMDGDTGHISKTIIDGSKAKDPQKGSTVSLVTNEDENSILSGFTITGGTGTVVEGNKLQYIMGGGLYITAGGCIEFNKITANSLLTTTPGQGYDIYSYGAGMAVVGETEHTLIIMNNKIFNNSVQAISGGGAGVLMRTKSLIRFEKNLVSKNIYLASEGHAAGGIYIAGNRNYQGDYFLLNNCIIKNEAQSMMPNLAFGGGIYIENSSPWLINNVIQGNKSSAKGGGVNVSYWSSYGGADAIPFLINNTITKNKALEGGGIYIFTNGNSTQAVPYIMNSILWGDTADIGSEIHLGNSKVNITYSDIQGGWEAEGNINADPMLMDTSMSSCEIMHCCLSCNSPCIDAGCANCQFSDPEDPSNPGFALWPAYGTIRNDIGAHGGHGAIFDVTSVEQNISTPPAHYHLSQNYPNPFNPDTKIEFTLPVSELVKLQIFNVLGQEIITLIFSKLPAGSHSQIWRPENQPSGFYYCRLLAGSFEQVRKMIFLK